LNDLKKKALLLNLYVLNQFEKDLDFENSATIRPIGIGHTSWVPLDPKKV